MSEMPIEVFVIYDACRDTASAVFDWGGPEAEASFKAHTQKGVDAEFSRTPPVRLLALTVTRPFFGRDTAFVRYLYELLGNSILAKLLSADTAGTTSATAVPVPSAEVEKLLTRWERLTAPNLGTTTEERMAVTTQPPIASQPTAGRAADAIKVARQRLREWFVPVLLHPVVARLGVPSAAGGDEAVSEEPTAFHGRVTLREDLARIGGIHPVARVDVLDGKLLLRARATGAVPADMLVISCLGSDPAELTVTPDGGEFRAELALPVLPGSASLADDYACVLSVGLREERTSPDE